MQLHTFSSSASAPARPWGSPPVGRDEAGVAQRRGRLPRREFLQPGAPRARRAGYVVRSPEERSNLFRVLMREAACVCARARTRVRVHVGLMRTRVERKRPPAARQRAAVDLTVGAIPVHALLTEAIAARGQAGLGTRLPTCLRALGSCSCCRSRCRPALPGEEKGGSPSLCGWGVSDNGHGKSVSAGAPRIEPVGRRDNRIGFHWMSGGHIVRVLYLVSSSALAFLEACTSPRTSVATALQTASVRASAPSAQPARTAAAAAGSPWRSSSWACCAAVAAARSGPPWLACLAGERAGRLVAPAPLCDAAVYARDSATGARRLSDVQRVASKGSC